MNCPPDPQAGGWALRGVEHPETCGLRNPASNSSGCPLMSSRCADDAEDGVSRLFMRHAIILCSQGAINRRETMVASIVKIMKLVELIFLSVVEPGITHDGDGCASAGMRGQERMGDLGVHVPVIAFLEHHPRPADGE